MFIYMFFIYKKLQIYINYDKYKKHSVNTSNFEVMFEFLLLENNTLTSNIEFCKLQNRDSIGDVLREFPKQTL